MQNCCLVESRKSAREDLKPVCPLQKGTESSPQPSCTKGKEDIKKRSAGKCSDNAAQKAGKKGPVSLKQTRHPPPNTELECKKTVLLL